MKWLRFLQSRPVCRIFIETHPEFVTAEVDGELIKSCGLRKTFPEETAAIRAGIEGRRQKDLPEPTAAQLTRMR